MNWKKLPRLRGPRWLRRFVRHQDGASAVEFALVATPFLALLFAIIETSLVFFAGQSLESAAASSARLIYTGQAENLSANSFKSQVCARITAFFDCKKLNVDVKTYTDFSSVNTDSPVVNGKLDTSKMGFSAGGPSSIVVMRLYYEWPVFVSLLNSDLANLGSGNRLLVATAVFRNEPY